MHFFILKRMGRKLRCPIFGGGQLSSDIDLAPEKSYGEHLYGNERCDLL